jgi:hypothetical protein
LSPPETLWWYKKNITIIALRARSVATRRYNGLDFKQVSSASMLSAGA